MSLDKGLFVTVWIFSSVFLSICRSCGISSRVFCTDIICLVWS